ncbi:hypothetical protein [Paenibacillus apiarius]|uniref:hypothetical protein n=1 Tax=Paenibacillus apiarius TaxID=46240 RepID=UPI003B3A18FE
MSDYASFFCALGESINGPGGYFGFDFNSLIDCLHGGYGAVSPSIYSNMDKLQSSRTLFGCSGLGKRNQI